MFLDEFANGSAAFEGQRKFPAHGELVDIFFLDDFLDEGEKVELWFGFDDLYRGFDAVIQEGVVKELRLVTHLRHLNGF